MTPHLKTLLAQRELSPLSVYFAEFIVEQCAQPLDSLLAYTAALVSESNQQGDVCLMLEDYEHQTLLTAGDPLVAPDLTSWRDYLSAFDCVGGPGDSTPLVLEGNRLYLQRFWFYESEIARTICLRLRQADTFNAGQCSDRLDQIFGSSTAQPDDQQKLAVAVSTRSLFSVISGGPGTGKTTTVIKILAVLLSMDSSCRIALAAPTGKAAARLVDSINGGLGAIGIDDKLRSLIPTEASTLHRLLGYRHNGFQFNQHQKLPIDCVVIDEASMIDLTLMYRLLDALDDNARVILLGDRDQLASVAAGNVFGDITGQGIDIHYSTDQLAYLAQLLDAGSLQPFEGNLNTAISDSVALLTKSYRFNADSAIAELSRLVNAGDHVSTVNFLRASSQIGWQETAASGISTAMLTSLVDELRCVVASDSVEQAIAAFESSRILCAVRNGANGLNKINQLIEETMQSRGWVEAKQNYQGRPILISRNDYEMDLFNGDIGMCWQDESGVLRAYFADKDVGLRSLPITSLPEHESAWAMTVHKSQGSEFESVILILPEPAQYRALSRELLYTGITRARSSLTLIGSSEALTIACQSRMQRHSGLAGKLGWSL